MSHVAVSAIGRDRPGIVAAVTGVLVDHAANLEDTTMSILRGHFAMMLVVELPDGTDPSALETALGAVAEELGLVLAVRPIDDGSDPAQESVGDPWSISVYGADRPGIVHRVTQTLADRGVNVTDLSTRVIGPVERPVYAMLLDVTLPAAVDPAGLQTELAALGHELGVDCHLNPVEADIL
jgi:glycine cleavage system transcriptional repressor